MRKYTICTGNSRNAGQTGASSQRTDGLCRTKSTRKKTKVTTKFQAPAPAKTRIPGICHRR